MFLAMLQDPTVLRQRQQFQPSMVSRNCARASVKPASVRTCNKNRAAILHAQRTSIDEQARLKKRCTRCLFAVGDSSRRRKLYSWLQTPGSPATQ
jgi:hypothetical protein